MLYKDRIQELCDHFNTTMLKSIIQSIANNPLYKSNMRKEPYHDIRHQIKVAIESNDFSSFYIYASDFCYQPIFTKSRLGAYVGSRWGGNFKMMPDFRSMVGFLAQDKRGTIGFEINIPQYRHDFQNYIGDIAPHEFAHAIVHIYYHILLSSVATEYPYKINAHGKEWKSLARHLGAIPSSRHKGTTITQEEVKALELFYRENGNGKEKVPSLNRVKPKKRFVYGCGCSDDKFKVSTRMHNNMRRGQVRYCKICSQYVVFSGKMVMV